MPSTTPKPCTFIATRVQQHEPSVPETRVATESRSRQERHVSYANTAATAVVQCPVQADGLSLRGRPTPSPQGVGRGGVRADTTVTVK